MVVLLVLFTITVFLSIDSFRNWNKNRIRVPRGTMYTTPGFEALGCLAQDGGSVENPITPLTPEQTAKEESQAAKERYLHRTLVGLDQFVNVLAGGHPDETISARAARAAEQNKMWGKGMSSFLNLFQKDHGPDAQAGDLERATAVAKIEDQSGGIDK